MAEELDGGGDAVDGVLHLNGRSVKEMAEKIHMAKASRAGDVCPDPYEREQKQFMSQVYADADYGRPYIMSGFPDGKEREILPSSMPNPPVAVNTKTFHTGEPYYKLDVEKCQCSVDCDNDAAGDGAPEPTLCHQCNGEGCDPK